MAIETLFVPVIHLMINLVTMKYGFRNGALLFALVIISFLSSCEKNLSGSGEILTKEYPTVGFNFVEFNTVGNVHIIQGDKPTVTLTTHENIHNRIRVESINNRLILDIENGYTIKNYDILKFDITLPDVTGAELNGAGNIIFPDSISSESFRTDLDGSGNISVNSVNSELVITKLDGSGNMDFNEISTKNLHIVIDGSGDIKMSGKTDVQNIRISGSGNISNFRIPSNTTNIAISGSGNCELSASDFLNAEISGSGNIYYKGAAVVDIKLSGSGQLIRTP